VRKICPWRQILILETETYRNKKYREGQMGGKDERESGVRET